MKSGIFPEKSFPSILLQGVDNFKTLLNLEIYSIDEVVLTNPLDSSGCQMFLVLFHLIYLQKQRCEDCLQDFHQ